MPLMTLRAHGREAPPDWAVKQRALIEVMNRAGPPFLEKYTRPDGTLIWRKEWPGMDGSDDGYESFLSFPLFYLLGGDEWYHSMGRKEWNAVTWQFTEYGQVHREFDAYYDWMHHGESYTYLYYLAMADPNHHMDRARALRFAGMYTGEDAEAPNWDRDLKMIRSPINGSKGPQFVMSSEDWSTHRWVLAQYLSPYEDVPGFDSSDPMCKLDWEDDAVFEEILRRMNERMVPGDVPLNLMATSLITNAFLYTGDEKYRRWVLDYVTMWMNKIEANDGIIPDNIGPTGKIGERMDGKWWGGYYGWRWPHGAGKILEATLIAASNAVLLSGDLSWLELHRSQADRLWELRREENGKVTIPNRHGDAGWFHYVESHASFYVHLYFMSRDPRDLSRLKERLPGWENWRSAPSFDKAGAHSPLAWFAYHQGVNPDFPRAVIEATRQGVHNRLDEIDNDNDDYESWDVHHWQNLNPVLPEGLIQMAFGSPAPVYHGGLLHACLRYFDPLKKRPGLPGHTAALVEEIRPDGLTFSLVNTDPLETRNVVVQAGAFGEHAFTEVALDGADTPTPINAKAFQVALGPGARVRITAGLKRFVHSPTYEYPRFS